MKETKIKLPTFSVQQNPEDEEGIYLNFGQVQILIARDLIGPPSTRDELPRPGKLSSSNPFPTE